MIPGMKAAFVFWLAFGIVCAIPVVSQTSDRTETLSRVSSVSIASSGKKDDKTQVGHDSSGRELSVPVGRINLVIQNSSGHAITAYDVLFVPKGVKKKRNHYACNDGCIGHPEVGSMDQPLIAAGAKKEDWYAVGEWAGGTVVLEAAIFDDGSYDGGERAAAFLVAKQLGNQAEYDRILSAVEPIVTASGPQMVEKGTQIDSTLAALQVEPDEEQLDNFSRWFPNIRDCDHHFQQIMQNASTEAITKVRNSLQGFMSAPAAHTETALNQWWEPQKHQMDALGCNNCGTKLATPTPPVRNKTLSIGCKAAPIPGGTNAGVVQLADDDSASDDDDNGDDADQTADAANPDPTPAAQSDAQQGNSAPATPSESALSTATSSDDAASSAQTSTSSRCLPMAPGHLGVAVLGGAEGISPAAEAGAPRPVSDAQLYPRYFRYVEAWDRCLADGQWPDETMERFPSPYPDGMNEDQREVLLLLASDWVEQQRENSQPRPVQGERAEAATAVSAAVPDINAPHVDTPENDEPATASAIPAARMAMGQPTTWAQAQQMLERRQHLVDQRNERNKIIESRVQSMKLALGKTSFAALDDYAHQIYNAAPGRVVRQPLAENAMYARYVRLIGLMDKFADNDDDDGRAALKARAQEQAASGLSKNDERALEDIADSMRDLAHRRRAALPADGGTSLPATLPVMRGDAGARPMGALVDRLRSNLSKTGFEALENRIHELYDSEGVDRVVALGTPDPPAARQADAEPSNPR